MAPDVINYPAAAENWTRIKNRVVTIINNLQETAKDMLDAEMKIKVVFGSVEKMEKVLFSSE